MPPSVGFDREQERETVPGTAAVSRGAARRVSGFEGQTLRLQSPSLSLQGRWRHFLRARLLLTYFYYLERNRGY
ncbi:hypothetical protein E2C01_000474 [Portunus trituberculatus]|uniref:Uncharacterized protein n=1 Tax=Portunus trituberculatus TaxID=210409 RepID=A0A5B7CES5_PORTR|nr:hypothetical protein [Portunus trituberculatus]